MTEVFRGEPGIRLMCSALLLILSTLVGNTSGQACKAAVVFPDKSALADKIGAFMQYALSLKCTIVDPAMAEAAFKSQEFPNPYNLSLENARNFSAAVGADLFVLVRSDVQKRASFERGEVFEAYSQMYLVDGKSGRLLLWHMMSENAEEEAESTAKLVNSLQSQAGNLGQMVDESLKRVDTSPLSDDEYGLIDGDELSESLRAPAPYKRISPQYTDLARMYRIESTVEAVVYIDRNGKTKRVMISRWAGFGLDESVTDALTAATWRAAEKNGSPVPSRVLVRYNFKRLPK